MFVFIIKKKRGPPKIYIFLILKIIIKITLDHICQGLLLIAVSILYSYWVMIGAQ